MVVVGEEEGLPPPPVASPGVGPVLEASSCLRRVLEEADCVGVEEEGELPSLEVGVDVQGEQGFPVGWAEK